MHTKLVRTFIVVRILNDLSIAWTFTTYVLFILSTGNTLLAANLANVVFMVTNFFLDPFTGNWGDRYGHRQVFLLGQLVWALGTFVYFLSFNLLHFAVAEFIAAIGRSLESEALEAWLENLVGHDIAHKTRSDADAIAKIASITSAVLGSVIGLTFGFRIVWLIASLSSLITFGISFWLLQRTPNFRIAGQFARRSLSAKRQFCLVLAGLKRSWRVPELRTTLFFTLVTAGLFQPINMFWSAIITGRSAEDWALGGMWAGVAVAIAFGSLLAKYFKPVKTYHFALVMLAAGLPIIFAVILTGWQAPILMFLLHEIPRGLIRNLTASYASRFIKDRQRAMMNSVRSSAGMLGAATGLIVSGVLTLILTPEQVWLLSGISLSLGAIAFFR